MLPSLPVPRRVGILVRSSKAMASGARIAGLSMLALLALAGCAENPMMLSGQVQQYQKEQVAMNRQYQQLQDRARTLDQANQDLSRRLALADQQTQLADERLRAVQDQLRTLTTQLADSQTEQRNSEQKSQALSASLHRQTGVSITPNNSFLQTLPALSQPGVHVRRDGDTIRIELPASQLFDPGGAQLAPGPRASSPRWPANSAATIPTRSSASRDTPTATRCPAASGEAITSCRSSRRWPSTRNSAAGWGCGRSSFSSSATDRTIRRSPTPLPRESSAIAAWSWSSTRTAGDSRGWRRPCCRLASGNQ